MKRQKERNIPSAAITMAGPDQCQELGNVSRCPKQIKGLKHLNHPLLLSQAQLRAAESKVKQLGLKLVPIWETNFANAS